VKCDICGNRIYDEGINVCCVDEIKAELTKLRNDTASLRLLREINPDKDNPIAVLVPTFVGWAVLGFNYDTEHTPIIGHGGNSLTAVQSAVKTLEGT
jgi:hypothetical protein